MVTDADFAVVPTAVPLARTPTEAVLASPLLPTCSNSLLDSPAAPDAPDSVSSVIALDAPPRPLASTAPVSIASSAMPAVIVPLPNSISRIVTPLDADAWERELAAAGLLSEFVSIPHGLRNGFDVGIDRDATMSRFSDSCPYTLYKNHTAAARYPGVITAMIEEETREGRISAFYEPDELYKLVGPFRNAPLTVAAKDNDFSNGRVCQDFSYPRDDPHDVSFNKSINPDNFTCDWGTFSQCYLLAARAPEGTQVAVFDVKAAHRRVPVQPWQQAFYAIMWLGLVALNHCCQFGAASSSGLWGRLADAFRGIFMFNFPSSDSINWADDFTFWRYQRDDGTYDISEDDIYALAARLGWPWSKKKTRPFSSRFRYLGFDWDLVRKTVEITEEKKAKYLNAITGWETGSKVAQDDVRSVLGKLVHCSLVVRDGSSRLPLLSRFAAAFPDRAPNARFKLPESIAADISWWRTRLSQPFCGMPVRKIPAPSAVEIFVDASTSWGIGLTVDGDWDHWQLRDGWKSDGRDIGWAEMVAVELGLRVLIERGHKNEHIRLRSDNQGVVGALEAGKSRGMQANRILQRIVCLMLEHDIWLSVEWVASADNPADAPSCGLAPSGFTRRAHDFKLPFALREYVDTMP